MKAPRGTVVKMKPSARVLSMQQTIDTMRLLLAACVRKYGVIDMLALSPEQIAAVQSGNLQVEDKPDGTIILRIRDAAPGLAMNG